MEPLAVLSLVLFAALVVAFLAFLRRAGALVAAIRDHERFQREVAALDARSAAAIDPLIARIEDVRHHRSLAASLEEDVAAARTVIDQIVRDAAALRPVRMLADASPSLVEAHTKADRAVRLIEHGVAGLVGTRGGPRELEAQTSLKRGALALRNARAEAAAVARRVADAPPPGQVRGAGGRPGAPGHGSPAATYVPPPPQTLITRRDDPVDPSM